MSIATLILGESGTGKSTSLRNLNPKKVSLFQCTKKPLPFRSKDWVESVFSYENINSVDPKTKQPIYQSPHQKIEFFLKNSKKDILIIDDFQYLMSFEFMDTIHDNKEKGAAYDRFNRIGSNAFSILRLASQLAPQKRVYILNHIETDDFGKTKFKTIGKLLDKFITPEGLFSLCLKTQVTKGSYEFTTKNSGDDTVKTPLDMFSSDVIPNDLKYVDDQICDYYDIQLETEQPKPQEEN